jgi:hypothetical protein
MTGKGTLIRLGMTGTVLSKARRAGAIRYTRKWGRPCIRILGSKNGSRMS